MKRKRNLIIAVFTMAGALALWMGCASVDPIAPGGANTGSADFSTYVAIGNSLTAGFQSGGLVEKYQVVSYPALIAQSTRTATHEMPLISENGIPFQLVFEQIVPTIVL